jgi:hypothetical protein
MTRIVRIIRVIRVISKHASVLTRIILYVYDTCSFKACVSVIATYCTYYTYETRIVRMIQVIWFLPTSGAIAECATSKDVHALFLAGTDACFDITRIIHMYPPPHMTHMYPPPHMTH